MSYGQKRMMFIEFNKFFGFLGSGLCELNKLSKLCKLAILLCAMCSLLFAVAVEAKMKGRCRDCHSMHASTPFPVLTKGGCVGCHSQAPDGVQNVIRLERQGSRRYSIT